MREISDLKWPCLCVFCRFNFIWVVMSGRVIMEMDMTFRGDGEWAEDEGKTAYPINQTKEVSDYGYPVFWRKDRGDLKPEPPPFGFDWTQDVAHARHFIGPEDAETAAAEAAILYPTLIGKLRVVQFRIR